MAKNRLTENVIFMGKLYTPDSERVPQELYTMLEESGRLEREQPKLVNPIDGYDNMTVDQVVTQLDSLDDVQKQQVLAYEQANRNRVGVVNALGGA